MTKSPSRTSRSVNPPNADDLKLINGIGPGVESRLHGVGVYTFAQLAALSPADIAASVSNLAGLTAERIIKQDWLGQARKLASLSTVTESECIDVVRKSESSEQVKDIEASMDPQIYEMSTTEPQTNGEAEEELAHHATLAVEPQKAVEGSTDSLRHATFTVELLLNEDNTVHSTHVVHIQSGDEENRDGWQDTLLVDFLVQHSKLFQPQIESSRPVSEGIELISPRTTSAPKSVLHLRKFEIVLHDAGVTRNILQSTQTFSVQVTLDLTDVKVTDGTPLHYTTTIYGRRMGEHIRQAIGEGSGTIMSTDSATVNVEGLTLSPGTYRLEASAALALPNINTTSHTDLQALIKGGLLHVY